MPQLAGASAPLRAGVAPQQQQRQQQVDVDEDCGLTCVSEGGRRKLAAVTLPATLSVPNGPSVIFPSTAWSTWCAANTACNAMLDNGDVSLQLTQPADPLLVIGATGS